MKKVLKIFLLVWLPIFAITQQRTPDDLKYQLANAQNDSGCYEIYGKLSDFYIEKKIDSALFFIDQCLILAGKNIKELNEASSLNGMGLCLRHMGR